jgi:serine/threonine-protein kinase
MSPEQHGSRVADARADQFSFCVALYEALYRELPFDGKDYLAYSENVLEGRVREAPRNSDVPARIRKVLLRGLSLTPDARYPSMDSLLADLARDPAAGRRRIALGAGVVVAAVAIGGLWIRGNTDRDDDPCALAEQPLASLWDATARRSLEQSFIASKTPGAPAAFERVARILDQRVHALRDVRRDACVATAVKHEQSPELLDRRIQCVDQRAGELAALIAVLSETPDAKTVDKSVEAVMSLPPIDACSDRAALLAEIPPPASPELRARAAELQRRLDRARALRAAGKYAGALAETTKIIPEADQIGYVPLRARAYYYDATVQTDLGHHEQAAVELRKAAELAATAHDDMMLAEIWSVLYVVVGFRLHHAEEARALEPTAAAAVKRAGDRAELRGILDNARGAVALGDGNYAAAAEYFLASARELSEALGPNHTRVAASLANAGNALEGAARYNEARTTLEHALAVRAEVLGSDHPTVATNHFQLGSLLDKMGQPAKALTEFRAAIAINTKALPPDSSTLASNLVSAGVVLSELHQFDEALALQERALEILSRHPADNAVAIVNARMDLANTYRSLNRVPDAIRMYRQALELATSVLGPDHPTVADLLNNLAYAKLLANDHEGARDLWRRALAIREAKLGRDHPEVGNILAMLVTEARDRQDHREVLRLAPRAIAIFEARKPPPSPLYAMLMLRGDALYETKNYPAAVADLIRARDGYLQLGQTVEATKARSWLAEMLWAAMRRDEAIVEMRAALAGYEAEVKPDPKKVAGARDWLAKHPAPRR